MTEPRIAVEIDMAAEVWSYEAAEDVSEEMAEELADQLAERVRREIPDAELSMTRTVRMAPGAPQPIATVRLAEDDTPTPQQEEALDHLEKQIAAWARGLLKTQE